MNGLHGIIFSYEKHNNLKELGEIRTSSSIPFGGRYRAVDFSLSTLVNAGVTDVGVVLHGQYQSLLDHVGTGKDWDLSRKRGGLHILQRILEICRCFYCFIRHYTAKIMQLFSHCLGLVCTHIEECSEFRCSTS